MNTAVLNKEATLPAQVARMHDLLAAQKAAYRANQMPSAEERIERLTRLRALLVKYQDDLAEAISADFGHRSIEETKIAELMTSLEHIDYTVKRVRQWMQPSRRHVHMLHQPAKTWVAYQPLGVVGIMAPWNYPLLLTISPLIGAFAAGNHAMIKVSSSSARYGALLQKIMGEVFPENLVAVVNGGGVISDTFCRLAFDFLVFTGSSAIGKTVMAAASENLTPVLLELGGKSPVIVHESANLKEVADRVAFGKFWNSGQTCVAPDYIFLPRGKTQEFVEHMRRAVRQSYPSIKDNPDYTSMVNDKQYNRLQGYLEDARVKGATIYEINPAGEDMSDSRKIAPHLIGNLSDDMDVCQNELFGPYLLMFEYEHLDEAIDYINDRPRPLALYYFDYDAKRVQYVIEHTHSGQFANNATLTNIAHGDLPFGGVGNSGMGKYHAFEGFQSMSNQRSMLQHGKLYSLKLIFPPFGSAVHKVLEKFFFN